MPGITRVKLNHAEINRVVRSPSGPVWRALSRYGARVTALARALSPIGEDDPDRGHKAGTMKAGIRHEMSLQGKKISSRTVSPAPYTAIVHEGRGPVRVKRAKALKFRPKGAGKYLFREKVGPAAPQPFMRKALDLGQPWPVRRGSSRR